MAGKHQASVIISFIAGFQPINLLLPAKAVRSSCQQTYCCQPKLLRAAANEITTADVLVKFEFITAGRQPIFSRFLLFDIKTAPRGAVYGGENDYRRPGHPDAD